MKIGAYIIVKGLVQGVGYRYFAARQARIFNIRGWVKNAPDGAVEMQIEGEKNSVDAFVKELKIGPRFSQVQDVVYTPGPYHNQFISFDIDY